MKIRSSYLIMTVIALSLLASCSKGKLITSEDNKDSETRYTPPPSNNNQNNFNRPREGTLSSADIQKISDMANEKASYECKIRSLEKSGELSEQQAAASKAKIIEIEAKMKVLQVNIDNFVNTKERMQYFRRAYDQAISKCQN